MGASEVIGRMEVSLAEGSDEWVIGDMGINKTKRKEVGWNWSSVWEVAGLHGGWTRKSNGSQGLENLGVREVTGKSTPGPQNTCAWWEWRNRWRKGSGVATESLLVSALCCPCSLGFCDAKASSAWPPHGTCPASTAAGVFLGCTWSRGTENLLELVVLHMSAMHWLSFPHALCTGQTRSF